MASIVEFVTSGKIVVSINLPSISTQSEEMKTALLAKSRNLLAEFPIQLMHDGVDYGRLLVLVFDLKNIADAQAQSPLPDSRYQVIVLSETRFTNCEFHVPKYKDPPTSIRKILPFERRQFEHLYSNINMHKGYYFWLNGKFYNSIGYPILEFIFHIKTSTPSLVESGLSSDLLQLYRSQDNADVTFSFGSEQLKAHKNILGARSEYFRAMFSSETKENQSGAVEIGDFEPKVFEEGLCFLYSGETSKALDGSLAMSLLPWADKYLIENLKQLCISKIKNRLDGGNVDKVLALANRINCATLKDACFRLMKTDMSEGKRWEILVETDRDLISEFLKTVDEKDAVDTAE